MTGFGHGSGFAVAPNRIVTNAHVVAPAQEGKSVAIGVVPSEGAEATARRIVAVDPARDLALLEIERGLVDADPALRRPARRRRPGRRARLSRQCRPRHRPLGAGLYHAAAGDPLGRHLLQRPPDQRHHDPAAHRQHRAGPFGRAAARPVRPGARRQHPHHPQRGSGDAPFAFAVANRELDGVPAAGAPALPDRRRRMRLDVRPAAPGPRAHRRRGARPRRGGSRRGRQGPRRARAQPRPDRGGARDAARARRAAAGLRAGGASAAAASCCRRTG